MAARENTPVESPSAAEVCIFLLGGFSVVIRGQPVADHWRLRKAKTLVKLLALAPRHRLHRDAIVDTLWPNAAPEAASNNLHQLLHNIRRMMGPESITLSDGVVHLYPSGDLYVDVDAFERAAAHARRSNDLVALQDALSLWTGPLLPEDQYAEWALNHQERLTEIHAAVATSVGLQLSEHGELEAALALLEQLAAVRPHDEHLHRALINTLTALGSTMGGNRGVRAAPQRPR
jgi:DNA-binding SARP family transcriptional activator